MTGLDVDGPAEGRALFSSNFLFNLGSKFEKSDCTSLIDYKSKLKC
jgi:hypothetical protein